MTNDIKYSKPEICPGCGLEKLSSNQTYCKKCFRALNYGEIENNLIKFNIQNLDLDFKHNAFYLITDIVSFRETIINNLDKLIFAENLTIIVNKIDLFPKSIKSQKILDWIKKILAEEGFKYRKIFLISSFKNIQLDEITEDILKQNQNVYFVGYSNVGKSSIIKKIAKNQNIELPNIISNTIGTTLDKIEFKMQNDFNLIDTPGLFLEKNIQNNLSKSDLKKFLPTKEFKTLNFKIINKGFFSINKFLNIYIEVEQEEDIQFWFSHEINPKRINYEKFKLNNKLEQNLINGTKKSYNKLIVIIGLGLIFLPKNFKFIKIYKNEGVYFYLENNIF